MLDKSGSLVAVQDVSGGEGRGGQPALSPRFTVLPGTYRLEVRTPSGKNTTKEIVVADTPFRVNIGSGKANNRRRNNSCPLFALTLER